MVNAYAPSLFRHIKATVDEQRHLKGQFILSGSQAFSLMQGVSESLAGRVAIFHLEGLSCVELREHGSYQWNDELLATLMTRGGFPELWSGDEKDVYL
jgi:hypothetical protein